MDSTFVLMDEQLKKNAENARLFGIIAMGAAGAYLVEGLLSVIIAAIPIPVIGVIISFLLGFLEVLLLAAFVTFTIIAFVKTGKVKKELSFVPDSEEKKPIASIVKNATLFCWIALGGGVASFFLICILNVIEFVLSFI